MVAIQEQVTSYAVTHLRNDIVAFHAVVRLTTTSGHQAFLGFVDRPPADWLEVTGPSSTVLLRSAEFDRIHHTLQTERPTFYTALSLLGIRAFSLTTGAEPPGEGPVDDAALVRFMTDVRAAVAHDAA
jgi:hypothetical protein